MRRFPYFHILIFVWNCNVSSSVISRETKYKIKTTGYIYKDMLGNQQGVNRRSSSEAISVAVDIRAWMTKCEWRF